MNKRIEKEINKIYQQVWKKIFNKRRLKSLTSGNKSKIRIAIKNLEKSDAYIKFCKEFAKQLAIKGINQQKGLWRKYYEAARKNNLIAINYTYSKFQKEMLAKAAKHNFKMIKSIPDKIFKVYKEKATKTLIEEVVSHSVSRGTFQQLLNKKGAKNAKLIARTETSKMHAYIIENRARNLGSNAYIWSSTKDKRTRPSHQKMNGVVVLYRTNSDEKPLLDKMNGNAGEFPNCRCNSLPIFEESDLPSGASIKFYNYKKKKIEKINRYILINYIEKGEII